MPDEKKSQEMKRGRGKEVRNRRGKEGEGEWEWNGEEGGRKGEKSGELR